MQNIIFNSGKKYLFIFIYNQSKLLKTDKLKNYYKENDVECKATKCF